MRSLWVRIGDGGEYEAHGDDLGAVIASLQDMGVGKVEQWREGGFETSAYAGNDYISLYYGDRHGNFVNDLDSHERRRIEEELGQ